MSEHVTKALKSNGHLSSFICCSSALVNVPPPTPSPSPTTDDEQPPKPRATITLPYVQGLSEPMKRLLSRLDIRVRFRANMTLGRILMRPKDPVPPENQVGVVYRIPCMDCPKAYVGQSGRSLAWRLKEHQRAFHNVDMNASALAEYVWQEQHWIDWSSAEVLDSKQFLLPRLMLESWFIHSEGNPLNRERGPLPIEYCSLIKKLLPLTTPILLRACAHMLIMSFGISFHHLH